MTTLEYCKMLMVEGHAKSWYGLHKLLKVSQTTPLRWKNEGGTFDDDTAVKVAKILGFPEERVLLDMKIELCKSPKAMKAWKRLLDKANPLFISIVVGGQFSIYILCKVFGVNRSSYDNYIYI